MRKKAKLRSYFRVERDSEKESKKYVSISGFCSSGRYLKENHGWLSMHSEMCPQVDWHGWPLETMRKKAKLRSYFRVERDSEKESKKYVLISGLRESLRKRAKKYVLISGLRETLRKKAKNTFLFQASAHLVDT